MAIDMEIDIDVWMRKRKVKEIKNKRATTCFGLRRD